MTPDEFLDKMDLITDDLEAAEDAQDKERLTAMYRQIRAAIPPDLPNDNYQPISYTAVRRLLESEAWEEARQWIPHFRAAYNENFYKVEFAEAVLEWHTGDPQQGQKLLQHVYRTHGPLPFRGFEQYLAIARDRATTLPPQTDTETDEPLNMDDPLIEDGA